MTKRLVELVRENVLISPPVNQIAESLAESDYPGRLIDLILVSPESVTGQPGTLLILSADLQIEGLKQLGTALQGIRGYRINYPIREVTKEIRGK